MQAGIVFAKANILPEIVFKKSHHMQDASTKFFPFDSERPLGSRAIFSLTTKTHKLQAQQLMVCGIMKTFRGNWFQNKHEFLSLF